MSENRRNRPGGVQGNNSGATDEKTNNNKRYEGFEGMNYEQIRQPYPFSKSSNRNNSDNHGTSTRQAI
jgi:hypothetical protein